MTPRQIIQGFVEAHTDVEDSGPVVSDELMEAAREYVAAPDAPSPLPEPELETGGAPGRVQSDGEERAAPSCNADKCGRFWDANAKRWACRAWAHGACHGDPAPAPRDQAIRELAEEIARNVAGAAGEEPGEGDHVYSGALDHWEARLRAALPSVSALLGELGTMREAIRPLFDGERAIAHELNSSGDLDRLRAALAPGSGRLAWEVLVEAIRLGRSGSMGTRALTSRVDALLAAYPELGREVEGG